VGFKFNDFFFLLKVSEPALNKGDANSDDQTKSELVARSESPELLVKHPLQVQFKYSFTYQCSGP
jgi:hypothetical protein